MTNNFDLPEDDLKEAEAMGASAADKLRALFDHFIESRLIGLRYIIYYPGYCTTYLHGKMTYRKPDPQIYHYACQVIGVQPNEAIFLDDIGMNLRSANQLGMKTVRKYTL